VLTYVDGDVSVQAGGSWNPAEMGDEVSTASVIKTGKASVCDLQFGQLGVLHLAAETVVDLKKVRIASQKKAVDLELVAGTVTAKVAKLTGDQRFQVRTATVVAGVRGTRFMVTVKAKGRTSIAVAEGLVALIPPTLDNGALDALATDPGREALVTSVVGKVMESASSIGVGSEVEVTPASMAASSQAITQVVEALTAVLEAAPAPGAPATTEVLAPPAPEPLVIPAILTQKLTQFQDAAPSAPAQPVRPLTKATQASLEKTAHLQILDVPPVKGQPAPAPQEPPPEAPKEKVKAAAPQASEPAPAVVLPLKAPQLVSPGLDEVVDVHKKTSVKFTWKAVAEATEYLVRLQSVQDSGSLLIREWKTDQTSVSLDKFDSLKLGTYRWDVTAQAPGLEGAAPRTSSARSSFVLDKDGQLSAPAIEFN